MDFSLSPEVEAHRQTIRRIIRETFTPAMVERQHTTGTFDCPEVVDALAAEGVIERAIPGLGKGDPIELWMLFNELEKAAVPHDALAISVMIAGVVALHMRVRLSAGALWALSVWGALHMAGGLVHVPESWPITWKSSNVALGSSFRFFSC